MGASEGHRDQGLPVREDDHDQDLQVPQVGQREVAPAQRLAEMIKRVKLKDGEKLIERAA